MPTSCGKGKVRNPKTNRCVSRGSKALSKPTSKGVGKLSSCGKGRVRNPKTNRCVSRGSKALSKPTSQRRKSSSGLKRSYVKGVSNKELMKWGLGPNRWYEKTAPSRRSSGKLSSCGKGKVRNPKTNRCVSRGSKALSKPTRKARKPASKPIIKTVRSFQGKRGRVTTKPKHSKQKGSVVGMRPSAARYYEMGYPEGYKVTYPNADGDLVTKRLVPYCTKNGGCTARWQ